ncbi:MAG: DUF2283 domain-containing protein [Nanoarchaeota archaeon]
MQKFNFDYDGENDDLFIYSSHSKSKASVEIGDLTLDYNTKKELVAIEIMNASEMLKSSVKPGSSIKQALSGLVSCGMQVEPKNNMLMIKIFMKSKASEIAPQVLYVPHIKKPSPALAN